MQHLYVYLNNRRVGTLSSELGRLSFVYDEAYLQSPNAVPLAYVLPLSRETYRSGALVAFFSNLLPDESVRLRIARILGISANNIFAMLRAIGEDCAGAVALYPPERAPRPAEPEYAELSEDEAHEVLSSLAVRPLNIGAKDFRISGAGAQDKLVACVRSGRVLLPLHGTPSTHIIKPGIERFPESVFNELYCMRLAAACGLRVAESDILTIKGIAYYVTTRYDRRVSGRNCERLHQEDFCQLLGYEPSVKYQSEGGPSLRQCFELMRDMALSAGDVIEFLKRIIFVFLVGNGDAHAKNFSVLYTNNRPGLAPAYDLISTTVYPALAPKLAMKIEGRYDFRWITRNKMLRMAAKMGLSSRLAEREMDKLLRRLGEILPVFTANMVERYPSAIYSDIRRGIEARMQQLLSAPPR